MLLKYFTPILKTLFVLFLIIYAFNFFKTNYLIGIDSQPVKCLNYSMYLIKRNNFLAFKSDKRMAAYFPVGKIFIKKIAARQGDIINTVGDKFFVNGKFVAKAIKYDLTGKPVKHVMFHNYKLKAGEYFVLGTNRFSYDSRYWGLVYEKQIIGYAQPIF